MPKPEDNPLEFVATDDLIIELRTRFDTGVLSVHTAPNYHTWHWGELPGAIGLCTVAQRFLLKVISPT